MNQPKQVESPRYKAFISYSHQDEKWARWLQSSLERYRVPRRLVGKKGSRGAVPARIRPVFRDREELATATRQEIEQQAESSDAGLEDKVNELKALLSRWDAARTTEARAVVNGDSPPAR